MPTQLLSKVPRAASTGATRCAVRNAARSAVGSAVEPLERRTLLSEGGGVTDAGLRGEYFANESLPGQPAFPRNDVRVDFDWGRAAPGGSPDTPYSAVGADTFPFGGAG